MANVESETRQPKSIKRNWRSVTLPLLLLVSATAWTGFRVRAQMRQVSLDRALICEVERNDPVGAARLLSDGADPNARTQPATSHWSIGDIIALLRGMKSNDGQPALALAIENQHEDLGVLLVKHGANDFEAHVANCSLLEIAVTWKMRRLALEMIRRGAFSGKTIPGVGTYVPESTMRGDELVCLALENDQPDVALALLDRGARPITMPPGFCCGPDPMQVAARKGQIEVIQRLLEIGESPNGVPRSGEGVAVSTAAQYGHMDIVLLLLSRGASLECVEGYGTDWRPPLEAAAAFGDGRMVDFLLNQGAELESSGSYGTAIASAARTGHWGIVRMLAAKGANAQAADPYGLSALQYARKAKKTGLVSFLEGRWTNGLPLVSRKP